MSVAEESPGTREWMSGSWTFSCGLGVEVEQNEAENGKDALSLLYVLLSLDWGME